MNFFAAEIHKGSFAPLFHGDASAASKEAFRRRLVARYRHLDRHLAENPYIVGSGFTLADAYLLTVSEWAPRVGFDLAPYAHVRRHLERTVERSAARAAIRAEGPVPGRRP